jgi:Flp pilus assembly protein TadD
LLQDRGEFVAAEQYILEALGLNSDMFQLWDTLGVILMKSGRFDEAENAIDRSLSINPDDLNSLLHMAEIQALKGNKAQALELVDMLARKQQSLSSSDQSKLYDIRQMAKKLP